MASLVFFTVVLTLHALAACETESAYGADPRIGGKMSVEPFPTIYEPNNTPQRIMIVKTFMPWHDRLDLSRLGSGASSMLSPDPMQNSSLVNSTSFNYS